MNTQLGDLAIAYAVTAAGMLVGLLVMRADRRAYWRWPVYSAMAMAMAAMCWNLLVRPALSEAWTYNHPRMMYFCALGLYSLLGLGLGILLGRLTGRKTPGSDTGNTS
jgi:hypothetical protein